MKSKAASLMLFIACLVCLFLSVMAAKAQVVIYSENFDADSLMPAGWAATPSTGGWVISMTNSSTAYTGYSGANNLDIANATGLSGDFSVTSNSFSTSGYENIAVIYGVRNTTHFSDSGSVISSFAYSIDNGNTWTTVPYTENPNNSTWSLINSGTPISLPNATNQPSVQLKWTASLQSTSSGTYRIDDLNVAGISTTGIKEYINQDSFTVFMDANKSLHISAPDFRLPASSSFTISDVTGRTCVYEKLLSNNSVFSLSDLKAGIYFVNVFSPAGGGLTQKIICY